MCYSFFYFKVIYAKSSFSQKKTPFLSRKVVVNNIYRIILFPI